jgi:glycosyltransferase involved in cell wall biosynthesis
MKNIVIVSGNRIAPATTGGQVRTISIARALARIGHTVQIFSTAGRREDYQAKNALHGATVEHDIEPRLKEFTNVGLAFGTMQTFARRFDYPRIWQYSMLTRGMVPRRLKDALRGSDIVLSDLPYCPPIPGPWRAKPWFLISHNLEHKLLEQASTRQQQFANWMRAVEAAAPQTYTDIFACAEEDRAFFLSQQNSARLNLPIIRCGVDPHLYSVSSDLRDQVRAKLGLSGEDCVLLFSGSGFAPNVDALAQIKQFCRAEAVFMARNRVYFLVVGSVSGAAFREGALIATGPVPEVVPYFAAADAGVNLVTRGSGSNVKLFEYLAAKLPVISTNFGVRGTELKPFDDYLPCSAADLKEMIQRFIGTDRTTRLILSAGVWDRHKRSCDIQDLVNDAISDLPAFQT